MKLLVDRLTQSPSLHTFEADAEWWREAVERVPELAPSADEPLRFELRGHRMGEDLYVEGLATGSLWLVCSRCLARYRHPLREPFRLLLEPAGERVPADPEGARALAQTGLCLGDELEAGWFRGSEIDFGGFFHEVVTLALPVQPLCREECRGLCPRCGADRNEESCGCEERTGSSPFSVLRKLRSVADQGED